jgi:hypothetical protein
MTARFSARLGLSFLLGAIAFFAFLLLSAPSASAHHKTGHETGNGDAATIDTSTEDSTEGSGTSGETEGTTAAASESIETPSGSVSGTTETSSSSSKNSTSSASTSSSNGKGGGSDKPYDPDPVHEPTPPATAGPSSCPSYDDGDAGPYDNKNCNGTQGLHGNGGNGKCAGCTGKADDKWPGGQNVGDHNNGYECDHNGGIGKGNPAHSRCASPPPPGPCVDDPNTEQDECNPPGPCVDDPKTEQDECNPPQPCVDDMDTEQDECNPPQPCVDNPETKKDECNPPPKPPKDDDDVLGRIVPNDEGPPDLVNPNRPVLPFTGATVGNYLWLAFLLMGAGALMLWRVRDRGADA